MEPIILIGGGGHCISCIDVVEQTNQYKIIGILDLPEKVGQRVLNYPIIGSDNDLERLAKECPNFLITVGQIRSSSSREGIYNKVLGFGGKMPTFISPLAYVSKYSNIGQGTIIMHHALVNAGASVGKCCIINSKALIEHEAIIGDFCHISTSAIANGQVVVGDRCFIGSNTVISNNTHVASDAIIGAGSQVLKSIENAGTYLGYPLRKIK